LMSNHPNLAGKAPKKQQHAPTVGSVPASTENFKFPGKGNFVCVEIYPPKSSKDGIYIITFDPDLLYMFTLWAKQNGFTMSGEVKKDRTLVVRPPAVHHLALRKLFVLEVMNDWQYDLVSESYSTQQVAMQQTRIIHLTFKKSENAKTKVSANKEENVINKIHHIQSEGAPPAYTHQ